MLIIEIRDPAGKSWKLIGRVPLGQEGSMSHNPQAGQREIYRFRCLGDHSLLERSVGGGDTELGPFRAISTLGFEEVARLNEENPTAEMWIKTDRMAWAHLIRFRHSD